MDHDELQEGVAVAYLRGNIEKGAPVFPEEFSMEFFTRMRKNPKVYAAQYANNPKEGGLTEFRTEWLKFYNLNEPWAFVFEGERTRKVNIWQMDRLILVDPSMGESDKSDETGIIVTGTDEKKNIYILEVIKERVRAPDLIDLLFRLHQKWAPRLISIEKVAFSGLLGYWFRDKCSDLGVNPSIYEYTPGSKRSKAARIRGLAPFFSSGQIYMLEGMHELRDEYEWFGVTTSDHLLDALAQGPELWSPGEDHKEMEANHEAEMEILAQRSAITGY
jgi:phage terminase large subunit-like protein